MHRIFRALVPFFIVGLLVVGCDSGGSVGPAAQGDSTSVSFATSSQTIDEGQGAYVLKMTAQDPGYKRFTVNLTVDQQQSTTSLEEDVTGLSADTTIAFPKSTTDGMEKTIPISVVDEPIDSTGFLEDPETLVVSLSATDTSGTVVGSVSQFTLTINENDQPLTVKEARARPSGKRAVTTGIVTRVAADGAYLQDDTGGLFVFDGDFAGKVNAGARVRVDGTVGYFSGLYQLENVSSGALTTVLSTGNPLPAPDTVTVGEVTNNGEAYESELIRVKNFAIDDGGDQTFQGGTNYTISTGSASSTLRIPSGSPLVGQDIPDRATFQGVLGQFNGFGAPNDNTGYQLLGLATGDLETVMVSATFGDGTLAPMTAYSVASNNDWDTSSEGGADNVPYAVANGFGADEPSNDWLITPALNFNNFRGETLTFLNAKGFNDSGMRGLKVKVSTDYSGSGDPTNATWIDVSDQVTFSDGDFNFVSSGTVDLSGSKFQGSDVYIAFQYQSTGPNNAAAWEVDNIVVSAEPTN